MRRFMIALLLIALLCGFAHAGGPGAVGQSIAQRFGGEVAARGASDGQALVWQASTGTWVPGSAGISSSRAINTTAPLTGGGDLSADRTISLGSGASGALLVGTGSGYSSTINGTIKAQSITFPTNGAAATGLEWQDTGVVPLITYPSAANLQIRNSNDSTRLVFRNSSSGIYMDAGSEFKVGSTSTYTFNGRTKLSSASDGDLTLTNNAGSAMTSITMYDVKIVRGSGSPEGAVTAPVGSIYLRTDGGAGTTQYIKESGAGNTGWVAVASGGGGLSNPVTGSTQLSFNGSGSPAITTGGANDTGELLIQPGDAASGGKTDLKLVGSNSSAAAGGNVNIFGGTPTGGSNNGGNINLFGGNAFGTNKNGGTIKMYGGSKTGSGNNGSILLQSAGGGGTLASIRTDGTAFQFDAPPKFLTDGTGAGTALLGTNSPAVTVSAPYTWITVLTSDGSTGYIPVWK